MDWRTSVAAKVVSPKGGAFFAVSAASALAATVAWQEIERRRVLRADLAESGLRVERLADLRFDREALAAVERGLRAEWGDSALLGFASVEAMAAQAGTTTFVARRREGERLVVKGALQSILTDVHGDAALLAEAYPTFQSLTEEDSWRRSRRRGGDTAVLLQITVFDEAERGAGLGSLLRGAALNMLPKDVRYALTTTPVAAAQRERLRLAEPETYNAAMRFHARGGAEPALLLPGFKAGVDVVVMRYARNEAGEWPAPRPAMRLRSAGPLGERLTRTARRLRAVRIGRAALPRLQPRAA